MTEHRLDDMRLGAKLVHAGADGATNVVNAPVSKAWRTTLVLRWTKHRFLAACQKQIRCQQLAASGE
jgi:hypothetical protein